jgi:5'-3' exonuclease
MSIKKTQKQYFEEIIGMLNSEEHKEFIKGRIEALDKKSTSRKPTAEQKRAEEVGQAILDYMKPSTLYTVTDLFKSVSAFTDEDTFQYANAVVQKLKDKGSIVRVVEKGKAYFRLA